MTLAFPNEYVQAIQPLSLGLEMERLDNERCDLIYHSHTVARMFPKSHLIHLTTRHTKCCLNRIFRMSHISQRQDAQSLGGDSPESESLNVHIGFPA